MRIEAASQAVLAATGAGRIGTPVSVRIVDHTTSDPAGVWGRLGGDLQTASAWLGADVQRLVALGPPRSGPISVLAQFPQGQTALVSAGTRGQRPPLLEAVVVASRGILSWEPGPEFLPEEEPPDARPSEAARRLLGAVRRSLASGGPASPAADAPSEEAPSEEAPSEGASSLEAAPASEPLDAAGQRESGAARCSPTGPPYGVVLVAGAHTHQENYAEGFAADPRCRLIGVADEADVSPRRRALNEKLAAELGIPLLSDLDAALARRDVHIASVCAEPERRARLMVRCAEAGKHLYLDKPMTASAEEAEAVAAAVRKAGVVSQMFSHVRSPAANRLRQLFSSGSLSTVQAVHFDLTFAKGPAGTVPIDQPRREHQRPRQFELVDSKRELYNIGVYALVLLDWLLGRRVRRVWAATANYFFAEHRRNDMEDFAVTLLELEGGATATLACGRTGWRSHPMGGLDRTCVIGARGAASVDAYRPRLEVWADEAPWLPPRRHPEDPMGFWKSTFEEVEGSPKQAWLTPPGDVRGDVAYFLDCIQAGRPSDVSAERAAAVMKVLMALYESAATGQFVAPAS